MKPTPFNPGTDLAPTPFDKRHCKLALRLKQAGLTWKPHVGCFVWDRKGSIEVSSPFPEQIYFILNLGHFYRLLGSLEDVMEKLVWLPTWHQARLLAKRLEVSHSDLDRLARRLPDMSAGEELLELYQLLLQALADTEPE